MRADRDLKERTAEGRERGGCANGHAPDEGKAHRLNDLHYYTPATRRWTTPYAVGHWPSHRSGHSAKGRATRSGTAGAQLPLVRVLVLTIDTIARTGARRAIAARIPSRRR